jgi:hypothetical protein
MRGASLNFKFVNMPNKGKAGVKGKAGKKRKAKASKGKAARKRT